MSNDWLLVYGSPDPGTHGDFPLLGVIKKEDYPGWKALQDHWAAHTTLHPVPRGIFTSAVKELRADPGENTVLNIESRVTMEGNVYVIHCDTLLPDGTSLQCYLREGFSTFARRVIPRRADDKRGPMDTHWDPYMKVLKDRCLEYQRDITWTEELFPSHILPDWERGGIEIDIAGNVRVTRTKRVESPLGKRLFFGSVTLIYRERKYSCEMVMEGGGKRIVRKGELPFYANENLLIFLLEGTDLDALGQTPEAVEIKSKLAGEILRIKEDRERRRKQDYEERREEDYEED